MGKLIDFTSSSGFEYHLEDDARDDLDLFEAMKTANDPEASVFEQKSAFLTAFRILIGQEQDRALRDYLKAKDGRVRTSTYFSEASEVFASFGNDKKK